ncbi:MULTISPECIES: hypothetical protein, partial [Bacteria]|uniref:hypothetical protein n=1 Tax=Bacteria TaxID=2 RepID=UPI003F3CBACE
AEDTILIEKILKIIFEKRHNQLPTNKYIEQYIPKRICNDVYFYDYFGEEFKIKNISKKIQNEMMNINTEEKFVNYLSEVNKLEIITEIILNTSEFIIYNNCEKTRGIHLINLLERYVVNNEKKFDNTVILKNKIKEILLKDKLENQAWSNGIYGQNGFEINKLEMKTLIPVKILLNQLCSSEEIRQIVQIYIIKTIDENSSIVEYINDLTNDLKEYHETYYLEIIYGLQNGEEIIRKNKKELLQVKQMIREVINHEYSDNTQLREIIRILEE